MSRKPKQNTRHEQPDESTISEETVGSSEVSGTQVQDTQSLAPIIDVQIKANLDMMIQATTVSAIQTVKQYMDQQLEVQKEWNVQCIETINRRFAQLEQANIGGNEHQNQEFGQTPNVGGSFGQSEGNYPLTPIINSLIMKASSEAQGNDKQESGRAVKYKITTRKFLVIDYSAFKQLPVVQGLNNPKAIETERIHAWWVMNWSEGQKICIQKHGEQYEMHRRGYGTTDSREWSYISKKAPPK
ncbi:29638_t:CDS:2 [Gigaspora margarita]|uniref:29638_t:CDS:1 n=1 Tax=Gigaspora margarita TaxID=4874 RepID=A0ABM8W3L8_GIGMA|nr:29638_t:CDS:2 [Gigaspora margarita]